MLNIVFQLILKFLNINDEDSDHEQNDKNYVWFIILLKDHCLKLYYPGQNLGVSKSPVLFQSMLHFKKYISTREAPFGTKLYELTTSTGIAEIFTLL